MGKNPTVFSEEVLELIARRLKAMSEPARLKVIQNLKNGEKSVGEIAEQTGMKHGTASANLNALLSAGLVSCRKEGTKVYYHISSDMVFKVCEGVCESLKDEFAEIEKLRKTIE